MVRETAIRIGTRDRLIPIMMTSLTTILGLLPLIRAKDQPGGELPVPLPSFSSAASSPPPS